MISRQLREFITAERDNLIAKAVQLQERIDRYEELLELVGGEAEPPSRAEREHGKVTLQNRILAFCRQAGTVGLSDDNLMALLSPEFPDLSLRKLRANAVQTNALVYGNGQWYYIEAE